MTGRVRPLWPFGARVALLSVVVGLLIGFISPAPSAQAQASGCAPLAGYTDCTVYSDPNPPGDQTFRVPAGVTSVNTRAWGAGGAGANGSYAPNSYGGGGGAFVGGNIPTVGGEVLHITVGWGGYVSSWLSPFGNGGPGGYSNAGGQAGSSGGGVTAVWTGAPFTSAPYLVAGAGGGAASGTLAGSGGGGGGLAGASGGDGSGSTPAANNPTGGSQTAGGAAAASAGCSAPATDGARYQGGSGASGNSGIQTEGGGGGGAGYFGGGGGRCQNASPVENSSGAGGSSFIAGSILSPTSAAGSSPTSAAGNAPAGNNSDPAYGFAPYVGIGGNSSGTGQAGGAGAVVFQWVMPAPTITAPASGTVSNQTAAAVNGTAVPGNTVTLVDSATGTTVCTTTADAAGRWSCTASGLAAGSHPFGATQTDSFGDVYPPSATSTYIVDLTPPTSPSISAPSATSSTSPSITGTSDPATSITVTDPSGAVVCTARADAGGAWQCTPTSPLIYGGNDLIPTATNALGNSATGAVFRVTVVRPAPVVPPAPRPTPPSPTTPAPAPPPTVIPVAPPPTPTPTPPPVPRASALAMNLRFAAGRLLPGTVAAMRGTVGPNTSAESVTIVLAGRMGPGMIYRSAQALVGDGADPQRCVVQTRSFSCTIVLLPGQSATVEVRVLADPLNAPAIARQQVSVSSSDPNQDNAVTVSTDVTRTSDTESWAATLTTFNVTTFPGAFLPLLALLMFALAATVAEAERRRRTAPILLTDIDGNSP